MADTIDSLALNLVDYQQAANDPLTKEVVLCMLKAAPLYERMKVAISPSFTYKGNRITDALPDPTGTQLNSAPTVVKTNTRPFTEELFLKEFQYQLHDLYRREKNAIEDPMNIQAKGAIQGHVFRCNDALINNVHTTGDANWVVGVRGRLDDPTTYGTNASDCKRDAGGASADMSASATSATFGEFTKQVDRLLEETNATEDGDTVIIVGSTLYHNWNSISRRFSGSGGFSTATDQLGRQITKYGNVPVMRAGRKTPTGTWPALSQAQVITDTETAAGVDGASNFSSLYVIRFGDMGFKGWSFGRLETGKPEKLSGTNVWQVTMSDTLGVYQTDTRALGRLFDIKVS